MTKVTVSSPQLDGASYLNKMKDPPATETFSGTKVPACLPASSRYIVLLFCCFGFALILSVVLRTVKKCCKNEAEKLSETCASTLRRRKRPLLRWGCFRNFFSCGGLCWTPGSELRTLAPQSAFISVLVVPGGCSFCVQVNASFSPVLIGGTEIAGMYVSPTREARAPSLARCAHAATLVVHTPRVAAPSTPLFPPTHVTPLSYV